MTYAQGCDTSCTSTAGFGAAVSAAQASDVTVVVVGEPAADSGEASSRSDISLPGQQLALVQAIAATGKPYVVVLMNGRPLTIGWLADNAPALLESWYPGTEGGNAVADVLFGKVNPGGKLPMSFPRNVGQIPIFYNELPTGRPYDPNNKYTSKYLDVLNTPQYPFGYGLSYTTFALSNLHLSASGIPANGTLTVTADHHQHGHQGRRRRRPALHSRVRGRASCSRSAGSTDSSGSPSGPGRRERSPSARAGQPWLLQQPRAVRRRAWRLRRVRRRQLIRAACTASSPCADRSVPVVQSCGRPGHGRVSRTGRLRCGRVSATRVLAAAGDP